MSYPRDVKGRETLAVFCTILHIRMNLQSAQNSGGSFCKQYFSDIDLHVWQKVRLISCHGYSRESFNDAQAFLQQCFCLFTFFRLAELNKFILKLGLCSVRQWKVSIQFAQLKKALCSSSMDLQRGKSTCEEYGCLWWLTANHKLNRISRNGSILPSTRM